MRIQIPQSNHFDHDIRSNETVTLHLQPIQLNQQCTFKLEVKDDNTIEVKYDCLKVLQPEASISDRVMALDKDSRQVLYEYMHHKLNHRIY